MGNVSVMALSMGISVLAIGYGCVRWPEEMAGLEESFDAIGSKRRTPVRAANWKVKWTKITGYGLVATSAPLVLVTFLVGPSILQRVLVALLFGVAVAMAYWIYRDAERHDYEYGAAWGVLVVALTFLTVLGGFVYLVAYVWLRE